jgi:tetratricopeptide (TPR) repeat protein
MAGEQAGGDKLKARADRDIYIAGQDQFIFNLGADPAFTTQGGCLMLANGDLPVVSDINDPVVLGVHRAAPVAVSEGRADDGEPAGEQAPAYIARDFDAELRKRLAVGGFVLLVGDSTAGKSRAAFEAMTAMFPDYSLIRPMNREAAAAAVTRAAEARQSVLWLDDLEAYLGPGGLTATQLSRLVIRESHDHVIIATLRTAERARITTDTMLRDDSASRALQDTRQLLDLATSIWVPRIFTGSELTRARSYASDPRVADALAHSGTYGIAEYLAAGPELLDAWDDARNSAAGPNARGAALVAAAIDIRCAGHTSPIPRTLLEATHELYLADPAHAVSPREPLDDAWKWATRQHTTTALLRPVAGDGTQADDRVEVFDYLVDTIQRRTPPDDQVPERVVRAAIDSGDPADKDSLGATANLQGRNELAEYAFRRAWQAKACSPDFGAEDPSTLTSRANLANVLADLGRLEEAEAEHRAVLEVRVRVLGADDLSTLTSRNNLASVWIDQGRSEEAEAELRAVLEVYVARLGDKDPRTLTTRNNLARALGNLGRNLEAVNEYRAVIEITIQVLEERPDTPANRADLARARAGLSAVKDWGEVVRTNEALKPALDELIARARQIQKDWADTKADTDTE